MVHSERRYSLVSTLLSLIFSSSTVLSQSISTSTPIPPLQWINLTSLLGGSSAPPPLKDASIGYDNINRNILIFGGESQQGFPQSQTYLLDLQSLTWISPRTPPELSGSPPARSAAISGDDVAASNRHGHIVIGGKGSNGEALSDVWEFDYTNQFWGVVQLTGPSPPPRWSAVGGIDIRTQPIQDPVVPGPNNSFYYAGGLDSSNVFPLSDVWRLNISGTLSSNIPNSQGSWQQVTVHGNSLPSKVGAAGAVIFQGSQQQIIAVGGCSSSSATNSSCAEPESYIINVDTQTTKAPPACPAPRLGAALAPNMNTHSSSFASQTFLLLGTFNTSLWDDGGGLARGEVAVLDVNTGSWARILPAGDPGNTVGGKPAFPSPREGAAVLSWNSQLVGTAQVGASDTLVFGGRDAAGNYLSEVWVLRAYNGTLTQSNQQWSGFGDGRLRGGPSADGEGVTVQYITQCASAIAQSGPGSSHTATATASGAPKPTASGHDQASPNQLYDTSITHKVLSPISVALLLPAIILYRVSLPSTSSPQPSQRATGFFYLAVLAAVVAFGVGIGGLASSFTSITFEGSIAKRSDTQPSSLTTAHGRAGLALFVATYGLVPILLGVTSWYTYWGRPSGDSSPLGRNRANSAETAEKLGLYTGRVASPVDGTSGETPVAEDRLQARPWGSWAGVVRGGRRSSESGGERGSSASPSRSFEVTNRPTRTRRASAHSLVAFSEVAPGAAPRSLNERSWLERRRVVSTMGELDLALSQLNRRPQDPSTPGTAAMEMASTRALFITSPPRIQAAEMPSMPQLLMHILLHVLVLALCILSLVALWSRAPIAAFAVFLAWTALFYVSVVVLALRGMPRTSIISVIFSRLRANPPPLNATSTPTPSRPLSAIGLENVPFPADARSPYQLHQPPYRATGPLDTDYLSATSNGGHAPVETDVDDDDVDDEERQRRIEEEMSRRDVSIVTVPKRKLFLTNPEPS